MPKGKKKGKSGQFPRLAHIVQLQVNYKGMLSIIIIDIPWFRLVDNLHCIE